MKNKAFHVMRSYECEYHDTINSSKRFSSKIDSVQNSDVACQVSGNRSTRNKVCTCKRHKKINVLYGTERANAQVSFTDFGQKVKIRKKVKKLYLPETNDVGLGSSDLSLDVTSKIKKLNRITRKLSTKCVRGKCSDLSVNRQFTAITQIQSLLNIIEVSKYKKEEHTESLTRFDSKTSNSNKTENIKSDIEYQKRSINKDQQKPNSEEQTTKELVGTLETKNDRSFSSDSILENIYNLESIGYSKDNKSIIDPMDYKQEREYRKMFTLKPQINKPSNDKILEDLKRASLLRKRFEALRQGLGWTKDSLVIKTSSHVSAPSHKDVSIASDPPSLEAPSFSKVKMYSPKLSGHSKLSYEQGDVINKRIKIEQVSKGNLNPDVKNMFRLWDKRFNLDDDKYKKTAEIVSFENSIQIDNNYKESPHDISKQEIKKRNRKFSLFRKIKQKSKNKKVTAARCKVGDALILKIGDDNVYTSTDYPIERLETETEDNNAILQKSWLKALITESVHRSKSVKIRWNNKLYIASSSLVAEVKDNAQNIAVENHRSKSFYDDLQKPKVTFVQEIKAWMMPKTVLDHQSINRNVIKNIPAENIVVSLCNKNSVTKKSKALSQTIKIVLRSKSMQDIKDSSEYIIINIPEGYFSDGSDYHKQSTDEEVYNVIEYDVQKSRSYMKQDKEKRGYTQITKVTASIKDVNNTEKLLENDSQKGFLHRDVVVKESNEHIAKHSDVMEVGIITKKDIRNIKQPQIKIQNNLKDDEYKHALPPQNSEFSESYLQDYYRNCVPLCYESQLQSSEYNSNNSLNNRRERSKSCPSMQDGTAIVSSCDTSCCSQCLPVSNNLKDNEIPKNKFFENLVKRCFQMEKLFLTPCEQKKEAARVAPKDSFEVFKRRKAYACSNRLQWTDYDSTKQPHFPNKEDAGTKESTENKSIQPCQKTSNTQPPPKRSKKHVILPDERVKDNLLGKEKGTGDKLNKNNPLGSTCLPNVTEFNCTSQTPSKEILKPRSHDMCPKESLLSKETESHKEGKDNKADSGDLKLRTSSPELVCVIPQPRCKDTCEKMKKPPCSESHTKKQQPADKKIPTDPSTLKEKSIINSSTSPCSSVSKVDAGVPRDDRNASKKRSTTCRPPSKMYSPTTSKRSSSNSSKVQRGIPSCQLCRQKPLKNDKRSPSPKRDRSSLRAIRRRSPPGPSPNRTSNSQCHCQSPVSKRSRTSKYGPSKKMSPICFNPERLTPPQICKEKCGYKKPHQNSAIKFLDAVRILIKSISNPTVNKPLPQITQCPPPPPPPTRQGLPCTEKSIQPKLTGIYLKQKPLEKNPNTDNIKIIRIISDENITVKLRQNNSSTEELRDGCNIKVLDKDGQTLFERRDYKCTDAMSKENRSYFVKDMHRDPHINKVSAANIVSNKQSLETNIVKSDTSVSNFIEINLTLRFNQGDRSSKLNNACGGDMYHEDKTTDNRLNDSKDVHIIQDEKNKGSNDMKDLELKIIIQNIKQDSNKHLKANNIYNKEFSTKMSKKFNTVSTSYSEKFIEQKAYSVQRAIIDLENSGLNSHTEVPINESRQLNSKENLSTTTTSSTSCMSYNKIESENNSISIKKCSSLTNNIISNDGERHFTSNISAESISETSESIGGMIDKRLCSLLKKLRKQDKKEILKEIFEMVSNVKERNKKTKLKRIKHFLHAVLTSDSSDYDDADISNKVNEEVKSRSLQTTFCKNTESFNDCCQFQSSFLMNNSSKNESNEQIYLTKENSDSEINESENNGCLCNRVAKKLNITENKTGCCCRNQSKIDENLSCKISNRLRFVEQQTQDSQNTIKLKSIIMTNVSTMIQVQSELLPNVQQELSHYSTQKVTTMNRENILYFSNDRVLFFLTDSEESECQGKCRGFYKPEDILQLNETKKAVLEIYSQKRITDEGERVIARLPKFVSYE